MWNIVESRQLGVWTQRHGVSIGLLDQFHGRLAFQAAIPMLCVVERLKTLTLSFDGYIAWEPLRPKKLPAVRVVEMLDDSVSPRLSNRNKHWGNAEE